MLVLAAIVLVLLPATLVLTLFSQASPVAPVVFDKLRDLAPLFGYAAACVTILFVILLHWLDKRDRFSYLLTLVFAGVSAVLLFTSLPCIVPAVLVLLSPALLHAVESPACKDLSNWFTTARTALLIPGLGSLLFWTYWIASRFSAGEIDKWTDWTDDFRSRVSDKDATWKIAFVEWGVPLGVSCLYFLLALVYELQSRLAGRFEKRLVGPGGEEDDLSADESYIVSKVKMLGVLVCMAGMAFWIGASMTATGDKEFGSTKEDMRDEVMGMSFWIFAGLAAWLVYNLGGPEKVLAAAKKSKVVERVLAMIQSEWACAGYLLLFAPFLVCHALSVRLCGSKDRQNESGTVAEEQSALMRIASSSKQYRTLILDNLWKTPVITKAQLLALAYVACAVGVKVITLTLSYTNALLASLDVFVVSAAIFLIGTFLFLLPPTPGPPVYALVGILVTASAQNSGWSKIVAVVWAIGIGFAIKMVFAAVAQKFIGEPLAEYPAVRSLVQMHTAEIRTIAQILQEPGITTAKVSILIGGPDWPVAVLCGMLRLRLWPIMLGLSPVLVQSVIPCVLSGALMVLFGEDDSKKALGETSLALAGGLQVVALLLAGYFIQDTLEKNYEELTTPRDEDREALELEQKDAERQKDYEKKTAIGEKMPCWVRMILVLGLSCGIASCVVLAGPWKALFGHKAFKSFEVTSDLDEVTGGNPLSIIHLLGWIAIFFSVVNLLCLELFYCWAKQDDPVESPDGL